MISNLDGGFNMKVALIAHDNMKDSLIAFVKENESRFAKFELCGTGTTSLRIMKETALTMQKFHSGPLGGDQEIGALIPSRQLQGIIFFRDPLTAQGHEPDVNALLRLCDVYNVPLATNFGSAEAILDYLCKRLVLQPGIK